MIPRLSPAELIGLQDSANTILSLAGWLGLVLAIGWLGSILLGSSGPRPVAGLWRRRPSGHPVCPACADILAGDGLPLQPLATTRPVETAERCDCCPAYRAEEETAHG